VRTPAVQRLLPVVVLVLSFTVFLPALNGEFLDWDDHVNLVRNEGYRGLGWPQLHWAFTSTLMGHYIPLTWLTLGANYAVGGMNPWGYHLVNLTLHAVNALLFYLVARRLLAAAAHGGSQQNRWEGPIAWGAAGAALIFAGHPLRVESVAWVTERRDVLSGFFFLLAVLAYLRAVDGPASADRRWLGLSLASFAAGLLSKASVMVLPAVLVLLDVYPLRRGAFVWRRLLGEKAGHWVLGAAGAVGALLALKLSGIRVTSYGAYGPGARLAMVVYSLWFYPSAWVWPVELSPLYELPAHVDPLARRFLGPLVGFLAVTLVLVWLRKRWPSGLAAWTYSALVLLPISGVVHAGFQLAHDRYSYLSGLGFPLLAGGAVAWIMRAAAARRVSRAVQGAVIAVAALVIVALGAGSWQQTRIWRDSETLWRWTLAVDPRCAVCANNLASLLVNKPSRDAAQIREAEALARTAIATNPAYDSPRTTLGTILAALKRDAEAEVAFREAIRLAPDRVSATANLGALYARNGRYAEALPLLRAAYTKDPSFFELRSNLGLALRNYGIEQARNGRLAEATALLQEAAGLIPDDADTHRSLGLALWEQGRPDEARIHLERALALRSDDEGVRRSLVRLREEPGRPPSKQ
jgi:Flp pilus assembly protein TadD